MFCSLPKAERRPPHRAVLSLEHLETRDVPAAPVVSSFSATLLFGTRYQLSGAVQDESVSTVTVAFTGVATGSTGVSAAGSFSFEADATGLGVINATASDEEGLSSLPAATSITNSQPIIREFAVINRGNGNWEFRGFVQDESPAGLTVRISGLPGSKGTHDITVGTGGWFSSIINCGDLSGLMIAADTTDWWGVAAQTQYYLV